MVTRVKELQKLADAIEQDYPHLHRTVSLLPEFVGWGSVPQAILKACFYRGRSKGNCLFKSCTVGEKAS